MYILDSKAHSRSTREGNQIPVKFFIIEPPLRKELMWIGKYCGIIVHEDMAHSNNGL